MKLQSSSQPLRRTSPSRRATPGTWGLPRNWESPSPPQPHSSGTPVPMLAAYVRLCPTPRMVTYSWCLSRQTQLPEPNMPPETDSSDPTQTRPPKPSLAAPRAHRPHPRQARDQRRLYPPLILWYPTAIQLPDWAHRNSSRVGAKSKTGVAAQIRPQTRKHQPSYHQM